MKNHPLEQIPLLKKKGDVFKQGGNYPEAIAAYKSAIALKPNLLEIGLPAFKAISRERAEVYAALGDIYHLEDQLNESISAYWNAAALDPEHVSYWIRFARALRFAQFNQTNPLLKEAILFCLNHEKINPQNLALPGVSLMKLEDPLSDEFLMDPLLLALLDQTIISDAQYECWLTSLRRKFLQHPELIETHLPFLTALAEQCQATEYVYAINQEEEQRLSSPEGIHPLLRKCYQPLATLTPKPLKPVRNPISKKVQAQYEEHPYPRWKRVDQDAPISFQEHLEEIFPRLHQPDSDWPAHPRILIAGCGTGFHAINTAIQIKNSSVLALDLSEASLAYAREKANEMHLSNIEFRQGDILEMPSQEPFDSIECVGVLHHMENAYTGWEHLRAQLKPKGWMCIGLYSALARQDIIAARQYIAKKGYQPTLEGIRKCRQDLFALPKEDMVHQVTESLDFYSASSCRDLLFNVHETYFTIPQISEMLAKLHLQFLGFYFSQPGVRLAYGKQYPDDPSMQSLQNWHQFELENPTTFINMYQFWVRG